MSKPIRHIGTIESVGQGSVVVRILQSSACASCQAARLCRSSESKEKLLTVSALNSSQFAAGQRVMVEGSLRIGLKAVGLAYVLPLVLLVATVMMAVALGASEPLAALVGLTALVPYGTVLWLLRDRLGRQFEFVVVPSLGGQAMTLDGSSTENR